MADKDKMIAFLYLKWLIKMLPGVDPERIKKLHSIPFTYDDGPNDCYIMDRSFIQGSGGERGEYPYGSHIGAGPRKAFVLVNAAKNDELREKQEDAMFNLDYEKQLALKEIYDHNTLQMSEITLYFNHTPESFLEFVFALAHMIDESMWRNKNHVYDKWIIRMLNNADLLNPDLSDIEIEAKVNYILSHKCGKWGKGTLFDFPRKPEYENFHEEFKVCPFWKQSVMWTTIHEILIDDGFPHSDIYGDYNGGWYEYYPNHFQIGLKGVQYDADIYVDSFDDIPEEAKQTWYGNNKPKLY